VRGVSLTVASKIMKGRMRSNQGLETSCISWRTNVVSASSPEKGGNGVDKVLVSQKSSTKSGLRVLRRGLRAFSWFTDSQKRVVGCVGGM